MSAITNGTQLMNLNVDCQLMVIEKLDVLSLMKLAETNKYFTNLVSLTLKRILAKKLVILRIPFYDDKKDLQVFETDDSIHIQNIQTISKLLKKSGHFILRLKIEQFYGTAKGASLLQNLINLYCSETLKELHMVFIHLTTYDGTSFSYALKNSLDNFQKPFKNVERIFLHGSFKSLDNDKLKFNEIFPAIQLLSLDMIGIHDMSSVYQHFSHLKELRAHSWSTHNISGFLTDSSIESCIKMNPNIQRMTLKNVSAKLLKFVADNLPAIESLELSLSTEIEPNQREQEICFENVTFLKIFENVQNLPRKISFRNLKEFQLEGTPKDSSRWIEFVERNQNLRKLCIFDYYLSNEEASRLSSTNPELNEITIAFDTNITNETIVKFINSLKNLMKIELIKYFETHQIGKKSFQDTINVLNETFGNQWNLKDFPNKIIIERKGYITL